MDSISAADTAWLAICAALVMLMLPGLGLFYSGLSHHKHTLSVMVSSLLTMSVVFILWFLYGFSLAFSNTTKSPFIGNFAYGGLKDISASVYDLTFANIPLSIFVLYQGLFAALTAALAFGALAERAHLSSWLVFVIVWMTIVYCPLTYWTWATHGWAKELGVLDFAGGTPVHICSGFSGLALALAVGPRKALSSEYENAVSQPGSVINVLIGTSLLWFGWFGFNGGSTFAINDGTGLALIATQLAASAGGLTWTYLEYFCSQRLSAISFCTGVVAALVGITPGAGYVDIWASVPISVITCAACFAFLKYLKPKIPIDDSLDVFGVHGLGGFVGSLLTGVFANAHNIEGGIIHGNFRQFLIQLCGSCAGALWSFFVTLLLSLIMKWLIRFRMSEEHELEGDVAIMGEHPYGWLTCSTPMATKTSNKETNSSGRNTETSAEKALETKHDVV